MFKAEIKESVGSKKWDPNQIVPISQIIQLSIPAGASKIVVMINGKPVNVVVGKDGRISLPTLIGPNDRVTVQASMADGSIGRITVTLPVTPIDLANINFDLGSAKLAPAALKILGTIVAVIKHHGFTKVSLIGYTDIQGNGKYNNKKLSVDRANAVDRYLKKALGSSAKVTLLPDGRASSSPVAPNTTATGQALNRRVEVTVRA